MPELRFEGINTYLHREEAQPDQNNHTNTTERKILEFYTRLWRSRMYSLFHQNGELLQVASLPSATAPPLRPRECGASQLTIICAAVWQALALFIGFVLDRK